MSLPEDYYGIVRINAEAKHRAHRNLRIIDLRIFSYFSRYINLTDGYFITDVMEAILDNKVLVTDSTNIVRDYLHPEDLFSMIVKCVHAGKINQAIDVSSSRPVAKQEILDYFTSEYGLKYRKTKLFGEPQRNRRKKQLLLDLQLRLSDRLCTAIQFDGHTEERGQVHSGSKNRIYERNR